MKVLLLGSTGYIGKIFAQKLKNFVTIPYKNVGIRSLLKSWSETQFDTIINCAGFVGRPNVDAVERNKESAITGNVLLPSILGEFLSITKDVRLMHVSTGCCYESSENQAFTENDKPNLDWSSSKSCSFYSGSKSLAEKVLQKQKNVYISRLRMPFDEKDCDRNYISKLINYDKLLSIPNSLSHTDDFTDSCLSLLKKSAPFGTYNVVNTGYIDAEEICSMIKRYTNIKKEFKFYEDLEEFYFDTRSFPRSNCQLSNQKLIDAGVEIRNVRDAVRDSLMNWT